MNLKNINQFGVHELNIYELENINGGASFAYRVGQALRFCWITATGGPAGASEAAIDLIVTNTQN